MPEKIEVSQPELKIIYLIRNLKPFEKIEIKLNTNNPNEVSVITSSTTKENFLMK